MLHFDHSEAQAYSESIGLVYDFESAEEADKDMHEAGLSQEQFTICMKLHAYHVAKLFTPSRYSWKLRFLFALRFLKFW